MIFTKKMPTFSQVQQTSFVFQNGVIRSSKSKENRQSNGLINRERKRRTIVRKTQQRQLKIDQHKPH
jgi:hypothetical protein